MLFSRLPISVTTHANHRSQCLALHLFVGRLGPLVLQLLRQHLHLFPHMHQLAIRRCSLTHLFLVLPLLLPTGLARLLLDGSHTLRHHRVDLPLVLL